jgi:putative tryptophan/tyrosine transport system substrate-binding protein
MNRRDLIAGLMLPLLARAAWGQQSGKVWRIGYLKEGAGAGQGGRAFVDQLREFGYTDGQNLAVEYRFADGEPDRLPALAAELVGLRCDLIAAVGTREAAALQKATSAIPILMLFPGDPVGVGLVKSLARPGANITGMSVMFPDITGKRLELLKEMVPSLRRVAILGNQRNASTAADMRATEVFAKSLGLEVRVVAIESRDRLDASMNEILNQRPDGLLVHQDSHIFTYRQQIADLAQKNRLVTIFPGRLYVESGGLISYGPDMLAVARRAANYVDKIFKGAKPADLPVEQPTSFELVINLKKAKALGLTIPPTLLARADEVIE